MRTIRCSCPAHRPTRSTTSWPPAAATSPPCSSPWPRGIPTAPTPSICAGTPSTTAPSSTGCPPCAPRCGWCRRRHAGPHAPRADDRYDAIDHVMTYFFSDPSGMNGFLELAKALIGAKRKLPLLPPVERGVYDVHDKSAAPRVKVGADVLPWWPVKGVYLLLERGDATGKGTSSTSTASRACGQRRRWMSTRSWPAPRPVSRSRTASSTTTPSRPRSGYDRCWPPRWERAGIEPLLAAPFYPVVPYEWDRYVP